jgi:hypothetical protein
MLVTAYFAISNVDQVVFCRAASDHRVATALSFNPQQAQLQVIDRLSQAGHRNTILAWGKYGVAAFALSKPAATS